MSKLIIGTIIFVAAIAVFAMLLQSKGILGDIANIVWWLIRAAAILLGIFIILDIFII